MKCPICEDNIYIEYDTERGSPSFRCPNTMVLEPNNIEVPHYQKYDTGWEGTVAYEEHAIALPYKLVNYFINTQYQKPFSKIYRYNLKQGKRRSYLSLDEVLRLPMIIEVTTYKKLRNKLKTLLVMS